MSLKTAIVRQFGKPSGLIGGLAGHIMARRSSNRIRNRRTVELMDLKPNSRVLEFGCGPGLALALCAETIGKGRIVGIDHSPVMIRQAKQRLAKTGLDENVELFTGGIERLSELAAPLDRVYSLNVIQFINDKADYYQRVFNILATGGVCFTTYQPRLDNDNPNGAAQMADRIEAEMISVGFADVTKTKISAGETPAICVSAIKQTASCNASHP